MAATQVQTIIEEVNAKTSARQLALLLNYFPERLQASGTTIRGFCPLHKEQAMRSLQIDDERKKYRCAMKQCAGFGGGSLVDLWAIFTGQESLDAALDLAEKLKLDFDVAALRALGGQMLERAGQALEQRQLVEARQAADQAVAFLPRSVEAARVSAAVYQAMGQAEAAHGEHARAIDLCLESGNLTEARAILEPLGSIFPHEIEFARRRVALERAAGDEHAAGEALLALARVYAETNDPTQAAATLAELVRSAPEAPLLLAQAADAYERLELKAELSATLEQLAAILENRKQWKESLPVLERRAALEPENPALREKIGRALLALGEHELAAEPLIAAADRYREGGDLESARQALAALLKAVPEHIAGLERSAALEAQAGDRARAVALYRQLSRSARSRRDLVSSTGYLAAARDVDPEDAGLRVDLAEACIERGDVEAGVSELFELARLHLGSPDPQEAYPLLDRISAIDPRDVGRHLEIGRCLEGFGQTERAMETYLGFVRRMQAADQHDGALQVAREARQLDPRHAVALELTVASLAALDRKDEAVAALREVAKAHVVMGALAEADRLIQQALALLPNDGLVRLDAAHISEAMGRPQAAAEQFVEAARCLGEAGQPDAQMEAAREALRLIPGHARAQRLLAEALEKKGKIDDALVLWRSCAEGLLAADPQSSEALDVLRHALDVAPHHPDILALLAPLSWRTQGAEAARPCYEGWLEAHRARGGGPEALPAFEAAVEAFPDRDDWRSELADLHLHQGQTVPAIAHLMRLVESQRAGGERGPRLISALERLSRLLPDRLDIRRNLAACYGEQGDHQRAGLLFQDVARAYVERDEIGEATEALAQALAIDPDNATILEGLGGLYEQAQRPAEAVPMYERLIEIRRRTGRAGQNIPILERLVTLSPERLQFPQELASLYEAHGETENALKYYFHAAQKKAERAPAADDTLELCKKIQSLAPEFLPGGEALLSCYLARKDRVNARRQLDHMGDVAISRGDLDQAEAIFKRIQQIDPEDIGSGERLGKLYEARGQLVEAAEAYRNVLSLYKARKDGERVISVLRKLLGLTPRDLGLRLEVARALTAEPDRHPEAAEEWLEILAQMVDAGGLEEARRLRAEAAPVFKDLWDRRSELVQLFGRVQPEAATAADWRELATAALAAGQLDYALQAATSGLGLAPEDLGFLELRVQAYERLEDVDNATADLRDLFRLQAREGNLEAAEAALERAVALKPHEPDLRSALAQCQLDGGKIEAGAATLRAVADLYAGMGDLKAAIAQAERLAELLPADDAARDFLASLLHEHGQHGRALELWRSIAQRLIEAGQTAAALEQLEALLARDGRDVPALRLRADLIHRQDGWAAARPAYDQLLDVMDEVTDPDETLAELERLRGLAPDDLPLGERHAEALSGQGRRREAAEELVGLARAWRENLQDVVQARRVLARAAELDPAGSELLAERAALEEKAGELEPALAALRDLARSLEAEGRTEEAVATWERRVGLQPTDPDGLAEAAEVCERLGRRDLTTQFLIRAIEIHDNNRLFAPCVPLLRRAIALNPDRIDLMEALGQALEKADQLETALPHWHEVIGRHVAGGNVERAAQLSRHVKRIAPSDMRARQRLAELAEAAGQIEAAVAELREMLPIARQHEDEALVLTLFRALRRLLPEDVPTLRAFADELKRLGREDDLFEAMGELEALLRQGGDLAGAIAALQEMEALRPGDLELRRRNLELLIAAGRTDEAATLGLELLRNLFEEKKTETAAALMRRLGEIEPDRPERREALARLALDEGQEAVALAYLRESAESLSGQGRAALALEVIDAGLGLLPDSLDLQRDRIEALKRLGRAEEALTARLALAQSLESRMGPKEAYVVLDAVLADQPDHVPAHEACVAIAERHADPKRATEHLLQLAEIHYASGDVRASMTALEHLLEIAPERFDLKARWAALLHEAGETARARKAWLEAAGHLAQAGQAGDAADIYQRLRELFPGDVEILTRLVEALAELDREPLYSACALELAQLHLKRSDPTAAAVVLGPLWERFPTRVEVGQALAQALEGSGDVQGAVRCRLGLAELQEKARRPELAKEELLAAHRLDPEDTELLGRLAELCVRLKQAGEALAHFLTAARLLNEAGRIEEAKAILDRALKVDPKHWEAWELLGAVCEAQGEPQAAARHYAQAARGSMEAKDYAAAAATYERLLKLDPSLREEAEAYARVLARQGRLPEAHSQYLKLIESLGRDEDGKETLRLCRLIIKENPEHAEARRHLFEVYDRTQKPKLALKEADWLAAHHLTGGEVELAERYLRRGLELAPEEIELRKRLIELLIHSGRNEEAAGHLEQLSRAAQMRADSTTSRWALARACELDPANLEYRKHLAEAQERAGERVEAARTRLEILKLYLETGRMEEAREMAERLTYAAREDEPLRETIAELFERAGLPEIAVFHYAVLAKSAFSQGNHARARSMAERVLKLKPRHTAGHEYLVEALLALGEKTAALEHLRVLYELYLEAEDLEGAHKAIRQIIQLKPADVDARWRLVDLFRRMGREEAMLEQMRRLAELHVSNDDLPQALEVYRELLGQRPEDADARARYIDLYAQIGDEEDLYDDYLKLAQTHRRQGDAEAAASVFDKLVRVFPGRPDAREHYIHFLFERGLVDRAVAESRALAEYYLASDENAEAHRVLDRALERAPKDVELRHQLATVQIRTQRRGQALETLQGLLRYYEVAEDKARQAETLAQMVEIDPQNADSRHHLAELLAQLERKEEAKTQRVALAEQYLARQLYDLAEREFRRILDMNPADTEIWERVIDTHLKIGSAAEVVPDLVILAGLYAACERLSEAVQAYQRVLALEPENIEVLSRYVQVYAQIGSETDLIDDYLRLAELHSQAGNVEAAVKLYNRVKELAPEREKAAAVAKPTPAAARQPARAAAEAASARPAASAQVDKAIKNYEKILKLNPENPGVRVKLAELLEKSGRQAEADEHYATSANDFLNRGELTRAIDLYQRLVERHPEDARLRERLSRAILKRDSLRALGSIMEGSPGTGDLLNPLK